MVCSCQALHTTYHPVLIVLNADISKRYEMKHSHQQQCAGDLIWLCICVSWSLYKRVYRS